MKLRDNAQLLEDALEAQWHGAWDEIIDEFSHVWTQEARYTLGPAMRKAKGACPTLNYHHRDEALRNIAALLDAERAAWEQWSANDANPTAEPQRGDADDTTEVA
jgi:hypothetical protein